MKKIEGCHCLSARTGEKKASISGRIVIAGLTLLLLSACAGQHTRLSTENRRTLDTGTQVFAVHYKPFHGFSYESTGYAVAGALFTPLLAIAQAAEGAGLQNDLQLEEPILHVKDRLIGALQTKFNVSNVVAVSDPPKSDAIEALTQIFRAGIVLDVRTMKWGVDNEHAKYSARARLIRLSDSTILWKATCEFIADKAKPSPTMAALKANGGMLLKAKILDAADGCADQLVAWATAQER